MLFNWRKNKFQRILSPLKLNKYYLSHYVNKFYLTINKNLAQSKTIFTKFNNFKLLGVTRDDAAGEAFDKVARILDLGYPGGPVIDRLALTGINDEIRFPQAPMAGSYDFSFSGTKTAVLYYTQKNKNKPDYSVAKVAYAFQESVVAILVQKSLLACRKLKVKTLLVGGGVAANSALRRHLQDKAKAQGVDVFFPPMVLCLDNAAMIAGLAYHN